MNWIYGPYKRFDLISYPHCTAALYSRGEGLKVLEVLPERLEEEPELPELEEVRSVLVVAWRQLYKNRSSRKINSRILFSREWDFPEDLFSY